ncbi:MAG: F0F1 ATP synthase subunit A [Clostridia bacterium]|nr:F0F1 ATP synthase subunit A [Clostridia bacterium]
MGISIAGAQIYLSIPFPVQNLIITEAQINSWLVMIAIAGICLYLTHGISEKGGLKRQVLAEWAVEACEKLVCGNMGEYFRGFAPFIAAILGLSALSSLSALLGLFPPTSDVNITAGWAILVFILITYYKLKCGPVMYIKGLCSPIAMTPLNVIGEIATPVSMAFRHYGNVLSGSVIGVLIATGLSGLSHILLGWLPGFLGEFPFLQVGLPAILSLYFDLFSGLLQAYIFAMLTMLYVAGGFDIDEYERRKRKKQQSAVKT